MAELKPKPCDCGEIPIMEMGIEIRNQYQIEKYRMRCPRCGTISKSAYDDWGAIEAWNRRADDESKA